MLSRKMLVIYCKKKKSGMNEAELRTGYTEEEADKNKGIMGTQDSAKAIRLPRPYGGRPGLGLGLLKPHTGRD